CAPASGTTFAIGPTLVRCSATDAHENIGEATFEVLVTDATPPVVSGAPSTVTVEATGAAGAVATWAAPTAVDIVDGLVTVVCVPASGSVFALGTLTVACTATDTHLNVGRASFEVVVRDTTPPGLSGMPATITAEARSA